LGSALLIEPRDECLSILDITGRIFPRDDMLRAAAVLGALFAALAGCASTPTTPTPAELVDYTRQGGLLGTDDHLVLNDTGSGTLTRRGVSAAITLDASELSRLREQLAAADFDHLDPAYGPEHACCDQFEHRIRYRSRIVRALDGEAPERLRLVLVTLSELIAARGRQP
jgi:hypothetical protein